MNGDPVAGEKPIASENLPGRRYDLYGSPNATEVYADGFHIAAVGVGTTRIGLYVTEAVDFATGEPRETRRMRMYLVVPTASLLESMAGTLQSVLANSQTFLEGMEKQREAVAKLVGSLSIKNANTSHSHQE
jgi:hypothetical protein